MTPIKQTAIAARICAAAALLSPAGLKAGGFEIDWWTVDSGGTVDTQAGGWVLQGTIGQWDATSQRASGNGWTVDGGFWGFEMPERADALFRDRFEFQAPVRESERRTE